MRSKLRGETHITLLGAAVLTTRIKVASPQGFDRGKASQGSDNCILSNVHAILANHVIQHHYPFQSSTPDQQALPALDNNDRFPIFQDTIASMHQHPSLQIQHALASLPSYPFLSASGPSSRAELVAVRLDVGWSIIECLVPFAQPYVDESQRDGSSSFNVAAVSEKGACWGASFEWWRRSSSRHTGEIWERRSWEWEGMEKAGGTGRARTRVVLTSRATQRNSILMMECKWKWVVGNIYVSCEEVTPQRKNAAHLCFDRLYFAAWSCLPICHEEKISGVFTDSTDGCSNLFWHIHGLLCGMRAHSVRSPRTGEES